MGIPRERGTCFTRGYRREADSFPSTGFTGPAAPARPIRRRTAPDRDWRPRSDCVPCSAPRRSHIQRPTPRYRSVQTETRCRAPQAPDSLDDGNRRSADRDLHARLRSLVLERAAELAESEHGNGAPTISVVSLCSGSRRQTRHARAVLAQATDRLPAIVAPPHLPRHDFPQRAQAPPGVSVCRRSVHVKLEVPHRHRPAGPRPCECRPSRGSPGRVGSRRGSRWVTPRASSPTRPSARPTSTARSEKR